MARLFGLIGNRADLGGRILAHEAAALKVDGKLVRKDKPLGWGLGFYQGGEVLMRRRPMDERGGVDITSLAGDLRTDVLIGHVRTATVGALSTENTHPFRFRQWLFAQTGTVTAFDSIRERLVATIPEFLRSGIRGETDAEVVFHVFLSFLHDAGRLNDAVVDADASREALRSTLAVVDATAAEVGGAPSALNLLLSNGEYLLALHQTGTMAYRTFSGRDEAEAIIGDDVGLRARTPELGRMHFTLIASDFTGDLPPRWTPVKNSTLVTVRRGVDPVVEPIAR